MLTVATVQEEVQKDTEGADSKANQRPLSQAIIQLAPVHPVERALT